MSAESHLSARDALQPVEEPGVGGRAEARVAGLQRLKEREIRQAGRKGSRHAGVRLQGEVAQVHQAAQHRRHRTRQLVIAKVQRLQVGEAAQPGRDGAR